MDTIGSKRAVVIGFSKGGCMDARFGAIHPEHASHLILIGCFGRYADLSPDDAWRSLLHGKTANEMPAEWDSSPQQSAAARLVEYPTGDCYSGSAIPEPFTAISRSPLPGLATVLRASSSACSQP
jgi:pimeloyl-ACP methyl ester carboxylesterase